MPVQEIIGFELKRVNPFQGLMVDASVWQDAHDYHRHHQRLHSLALHGWGMVTGMQVTAAHKPDRSVVIHPGLAIGPEGNVILISQPHRYHIEAQEGLVYLIIQFREVPQSPTTPWDSAEEQPSRLLEAYRIQERDRLPTEPYLELARIRLEGKPKAISNAKDPLRPGANEIDLRFREEAPLATLERLVLCHVSLGGEEAHGRGVQQLARHLAVSGIPRVRVRTHLELAEALREPGLVYVTGERLELSEAETKLVATFLGSGGVLVAEACSQGEGKALTGDVEKLADGLEVKLAEVKRGHALLEVMHAFAEPPAGAADGGLREGGGLILSQGDYGCAWQGGPPKKALPRATVRDCLELGANLAAYSLERQLASALERTVREQTSG